MLGAAGIAAGALGVKTVDALTGMAKNVYDSSQYSSTIRYAKKKHPELKQVPEEQLTAWLDAYHTLSPRLASNKELASSMLVTTHNYGGNIDLATAKLIADAGDKANRQSNNSNEIVQIIGAGSNFAKNTIDTANGLGSLSRRGIPRSHTGDIVGGSSTIENSN
jgi:hypothetical protein